MRRFYFLIFLSFLFFSCQESKKVDFKKDGLRFTCPDGWKIESEDEADNHFSLTMQKDGLTSSGMIRINCINDSIDDVKLINHLRNSFKDNSMYKKLTIDFDTITTGSYNGIDCIESSFAFDWWGEVDQGRYRVLHGRNKTISILVQEAAKHAELNRADFELFERSFFVD